ncbi:MAG: phosphoglycerate mutase, partial [Gammaproteobacteria bacterium]|nr:phosphoglycerate mutase [Gammaproteobacteria bacterium]
MKAVLIIIDGLGDLPVESLGGMTPLEEAATPVLDRLASEGRFGLVDPLGPGLTPSTYSGAGILMGMSTKQASNLGRGTVEAAGAGFELKPGDIALRANFATVRREGDAFVVLDRRAGRIKEALEELSAPLQDIDLGDGYSATLLPTHQHRAVLVLSGERLDPAISDTDPGDGPVPAPMHECKATGPGAALTARLVNRFLQIANERLADNPVNQRRIAAGKPPANGIITRGAGTLINLANVVRDGGFRASVVSGCNTVRGLGNMCGFKIVSDDRFTGDAATDLEGKVAAALEALQDQDLVFLHIKAPDIYAHDRQPHAKRNYLERLDAALAPLAQRNIAIAVAADHT